MPRISSTSCIIGTGFMKWMPMKRSGRSVTEASRVMEIEEVLVARMALFFSLRTKVDEDLALDRLVLGGRLDDEVGLADGLQIGGDADALQGRLHLRVGDDAARDLARHVALDGGARLVDGLLLQVVEGDVVAGQRHHVGDAVAHLAGADDADRLDGGAGAGLAALAGALDCAPGFFVLTPASMTPCSLTSPG